MAPEEPLRARYAAFRLLLDHDAAALRDICALEEALGPEPRCDPERAAWLCGRLAESVRRMAAGLAGLAPQEAQGLEPELRRIKARLQALFAPPPPPEGPLVLPLAAAQAAPRLAGGKAVNLAAAAGLGLRVPPGFVVSSAAGALLLGQEGVRQRLARLLRQVDLARPERLARLCARLQSVVLEAPMPEELARALAEAAAAPEFAGRRLAVRSSAVAEDGEASFAGQYASLLDVAPEDLELACRRVLAAKYRPRAVTYRILCGLSDAETPMAVLVLPMIPAVAAGVLHSSEALPGAAGGCVRIDALPGLGDALMAGRAAPRTLRLARRAPPELLDDSGGPGPELPEAALAELVLAGLVLEARCGRPQEVEWALDAGGSVFVLQARPHVSEAAPRDRDAAVLPDLQGRPALALDLACVSGGAAAGVVRHVGGGLSGLDSAPEGAVLAVESLTPSLARCLGRAAAVVAAQGSRASHFGAIAREFGLPVVSGLQDVFARLPEGRLVTVDADAGRVFAGRAEGVLAAAGRRVRRRSRSARNREAAALCCRLGLSDPEAPEFSPGGCASLHDLVRYCHEMATRAMFRLPDGGGGRMGAARRLAAGLPLALYLLDLGGALPPGEEPVEPADVASAPFRALWRGLAESGETWPAGEFCCDWQEFDRISAGIFRADSRRLASYALVAPDYLHLLARFGYHFAVLDGLCCERTEANLMGLRFMGGGGLPEQRALRAGFIARVLEGLGFRVAVRGDMLEARLARFAPEAGLERLAALGRLLVRSLRLDLRLSGAEQAERLARDFLSACARPERP